MLPLTPARTVAFLRNQLGSVRRVYLAGNRVVRRSDFRHHPENVLLLHGFFQTRSIWTTMEDRLRYDGYGVVSFDLGGWLRRFNTRPLDHLAALVADKVEALAERHGIERVHVVGHSKGGLLARRYVQHFGGDRRVASVCTLGTPHHGTPTAVVGVALSTLAGGGSSARDLLPNSRVVRRLNEEEWPAHIPLTSIWSRADLVCPHWSSALHTAEDTPHLRNVEVRGVGHSQLTWDPAVYQAVREHLARAAFDAAAAPAEASDAQSA